MPKSTPAALTCIGRTGSTHSPEPLVGINCRSFTLRVSVYDASADEKRIEFNVRCFFENGPRWGKWDLPRADSLVQASGDLLGTYNGDGTACPAILLHDLVYINSSRRLGEVDPLVGPSKPTDLAPMTPQKRRMLAFNQAGRAAPSPSAFSDVPTPVAPATPQPVARTVGSTLSPVSVRVDLLSNVISLTF